MEINGRKITPGELSLYSEAFCFFQDPVNKASERTGLLDASRLTQALGSLGLDNPKPADWRKFVDEHDFQKLYEPKREAKGYVDFQDFMFLIGKMSQPHRRPSRADLMAAFEVFDEEHRTLIPLMPLLERWPELSKGGTGLQATAAEFTRMLEETGLTSIDYGNINYPVLLDYLYAGESA
jgi:Ca2+-binding EF-hand superfamily protein